MFAVVELKKSLITLISILRKCLVTLPGPVNSRHFSNTHTQIAANEIVLRLYYIDLVRVKIEAPINKFMI